MYQHYTYPQFDDSYENRSRRGLGTCALGGYLDAEVNKLLDIQLGRETTLYIIAAGSV